MLGNTTLNAKYCPPPTFATTKDKKTVAQAAGLRYEAKALPMLERWAKANRYIAKVQPWIQYLNALNQLCYCQPDFMALSLDTDNLIIVEVKLRHTRDAFDQLAKYRDMAKDLHPDYTPSLIEICQFFDSAEHRVELLQDIRPHDYPRGAAVIWDAKWPSTHN